MSTLQFVKSKGGDNIQEYVNSSGGFATEARLNEVLTFMLGSGWGELYTEGWNQNPPDLTNLQNLNGTKTQIRYILRDGTRFKFRTGGFYVGVVDRGIETINKETGDTQIVENPFVIYQSHVGERVSLQLTHIIKFYVKTMFRKPKEVKKTIVKFKIPTNQSNFPVCMQKNGKTHTVYFARSNGQRLRFMNTDKFKRAMKYGWEFAE